MQWYDAYDYCLAHDAELLSWRSEGEYLEFWWQEFGLTMDMSRGSWTGAMKQGGAGGTGCGVMPLMNNDLVPMNYGWARGQPSPPPVANDHDCAELNSAGEMISYYPTAASFSVLCQTRI